jgi:hypothetical protein
MTGSFEMACIDFLTLSRVSAGKHVASTVNTAPGLSVPSEGEH